MCNKITHHFIYILKTDCTRECACPVYIICPGACGSDGRWYCDGCQVSCHACKTNDKSLHATCTKFLGCRNCDEKKNWDMMGII